MWLHRVPDRSPCLLCRAVKGPQHAGKVLGRLWDLLDQNGLFMPLVCSMGLPCSHLSPKPHSSPGKCHQPLQGEGEKPRPPHTHRGQLLPSFTPMQNAAARQHAEQPAPFCNQIFTSATTACLSDVLGSNQTLNRNGF